MLSPLWLLWLRPFRVSLFLYFTVLGFPRSWGWFPAVGFPNASTLLMSNLCPFEGRTAWLIDFDPSILRCMKWIPLNCWALDAWTIHFPFYTGHKNISPEVLGFGMPGQYIFPFYTGHKNIEISNVSITKCMKWISP